MKKTLKQFALLPLFCGLLLTVACNKNDDKDVEIPNSWFNGVITAVVENGSNYDELFEKVVVTVWDRMAGNSEKIASGNWYNGGFALTLPSTLDNNFLENFGDLEHYMDGIQVSDKNANFTNDTPIFWAYDNEGNRVGGRFKLSKEDQNSYTEVLFMYADRDVRVIGSQKEISDEGEEYIEIWNVSLKKGWNKVYATQHENRGEISTQAVSDMNWYFENWSDFLGIQKAPKNLPKRNTVFPRIGRK